MLAEGGVVVSTGSQALVDAIHIKDTICRLANAISETIGQLELFQTLPSGYTVPPLLLQDARSWLESLDRHRTHVQGVVDAIRLSPSIVLLRGQS